MVLINLYVVEKSLLPFVFILGACPISNDLFHGPSCADAVRSLIQDALIGAAFGKRIGLLTECPDQLWRIFRASRPGERPATFQLFST